MKRYKTIICYGTFDLFHYGHLMLLKRIQDIIIDNGKLIIGVNSDEYAFQKKGCYPVINCYQRCEILKNIKGVDYVFVNDNGFRNRLHDIKKYNADAIVVDEDGKYYCEGYVGDCDIIVFPRTNNISTTDIKNKIINKKY